MNTKNQKGFSRDDNFGGQQKPQGIGSQGELDIEVDPSDELIGRAGSSGTSGEGYGGNRPQGVGSQDELDIEATASDDLVSDVNEGEGSRSAARRYNKATEQYARSGKVQPAARKAEDAFDSDEGNELRDAEQIGKQGGRNDWGGGQRK